MQLMPTCRHFQLQCIHYAQSPKGTDTGKYFKNVKQRFFLATRNCSEKLMCRNHVDLHPKRMECSITLFFTIRTLKSVFNIYPFRSLQEKSSLFVPVFLRFCTSSEAFRDLIKECKTIAKSDGEFFGCLHAGNLPAYQGERSSTV